MQAQVYDSRTVCEIT